MNALDLTLRARFVTSLQMQLWQTGKRRSPARRIAAVAVLMGGVMALSGCVSVQAPDKPIVIELNINIKQEVVYRLAADAKDTIESNPGIF
jgi:hypothetical protein